MVGPGSGSEGQARIPLPVALADAARTGTTGTLVVESHGAEREVVFIQGEIRAAHSRLEEEKLGSWLVQQGLLSDDQRAIVLLQQAGGGGTPFGELLIERGFVDRDTLEVELERLTLTIIRRCCATPATHYGLTGAHDPRGLDTLPRLSTQQILLHAARVCRDTGAMRRALGDEDQVVRTVAGLDGLLASLDLNPEEAFLLSRLQGVHSVRDVLHASAVEEELATSILFALKVAGVIRLGPPPSSEARAGAGHRRRPPPVEAVDEEGLDPLRLEERRALQRLAQEAPRLDHYRALGLHSGAGGEAVDAAWQQLQARCHPKRRSGDHLRDMVDQLAIIRERGREAHEVLSDPVSRERYDRILTAIREEQVETDEEGGEARTEVRFDPAAREEVAAASFREADDLIARGEVFMAIRVLEQACAMQPRADQLLKLARLLLRNPLWKRRSLACLRRALEVDSDHVESWLELAGFWKNRGDPERQRRALEHALKIDADCVRGRQMYRELAGPRELDRFLRRIGAPSGG